MKVREFFADESSNTQKQSMRRKPRDCFESDFMEVEELVEEYKNRKKEEMRKKHRERKDKYFHDEWN